MNKCTIKKIQDGFLIQSVVPEVFLYTMDRNNYDPTASKIKKL